MHCRTNSQKLLASGTRRIDTAFKLAKQFPLVYCLFPGKSRSVYEKCFLIIDDKVSNLGFLPVVQRITTDFELALIQAAEAQFLGPPARDVVFTSLRMCGGEFNSLGCNRRTKPTRA